STMTVQGVPKDQYGELRAYQRGGQTAPTTADLRPGTHSRTGLAAPSVVGRRIEANVVLADLRTGAERSSARLAPDFSNTSLFDHDYDHFPAMVLIEGGRQLTLAGSGDPQGRVATAMRAEFLRFAELDRPTTFTARRHGDRTEVVCAQDDVTVSRMSFTLTPLGEAA
ncbi:MAG: hypothetical protein M3422_11120, partial [Actinomycetota bacterium]|nr:hypothetical protein [Actinomycetota bacterium]